MNFSRDPRFGFEGDAFVALFGDLSPITTHTTSRPAGFRVVRVDMRARRVVDFAVNKIAGPASKLPHAGFERPSHCAFGPDGNLYVVDWGEIEIAPEAGGVRMKAGTGTIWRMRPTGAPRGQRPPEPMVLPVYAMQFYLGVGAAALGLGALAWWLARQLLRGERG
ncbi:MAG: hypothetical protein ABI670_03670 [Chloroflexota bacterium]